MNERRELRHDEDACLDRTAEGLDFGAATPAEVAGAAERQVNPLRRILRAVLPGAAGHRARGRPRGRA